MILIKKTVFYVFTILGILSMGKSLAQPSKDSKWKLIPELSDEFEGEKLDNTKWFDHNPGWRGRKPAYFSPDNVDVNDGKLHLTARAENIKNLPEGYHTFTTASVKSKVGVKYGYFEIKCKMMDSRASSAFWFYNRKPDDWAEIDVFETGPRQPGNERNVWFTLHNSSFYIYNRIKPDYKKHGMYANTIYKAPYDITKEYHVYAVEWDPEKIKFYVDDILQWETNNTAWHQTLFMSFDSEIFPDWFGIPEISELPATYSIEYVRSWRKVLAPEIDRDHLGLVSITYPDKNSTIYYTTDGTEPTKEKNKYKKPFTLKTDGFIRAIAISNKTSSNIEEKSYKDIPEFPPSEEWENLEEIVNLWIKEKAKYKSYTLTYCHEQFESKEALEHDISNDSIRSRKYFKWSPGNNEIKTEGKGNLGTLNLRFPLKTMEDYLLDAREILDENDSKEVSKIGLYFKNGEKDRLFFEIPGYNAKNAHNYIMIEFK